MIFCFHIPPRKQTADYFAQGQMQNRQGKNASEEVLLLLFQVAETDHNFPLDMGDFAYIFLDVRY